MSTNERYGMAVWQAINEFDKNALEQGTTYWFTVGDIAVGGGVSKPTARKYINALVEQGFVARAGTRKMPIFAAVKEV